MILFEIIKKVKFSIAADRIGPDLPFTHWRLYFPSLMTRLCERKFKKFSPSSEIRPGVYIVGCSNIEIGRRVVIRPGSMLFGESNSLISSIIIEDDVMLGSGVHIYINNHKFESVDLPFIDQGYYADEQVLVKRGSWIGANVIILPGVTIGINTVVGAGSVVTKSLPDNVLAVGNPAMVIRSLK
jgi:acetyltransferase-like isoleucine patch superfamily enzyme